LPSENGYRDVPVRSFRWRLFEEACVLRLHLSAEDLMRTRFGSAPAPLAELTLALATLQRRDGLFDRWRRTLGKQLPAAARPLFELVPATAVSPRFLDPVSDGLDDGLDTVLSTPMPFVRHELREVFDTGRPVTPWVRALAERDPYTWQQFGAAIRAGHDTLVGPVWPRIWRSFRADLAWRSRLIAEQGVKGALASLYAGARWNGTTLEIEDASTFAVRPAGRGLTLIPSAFWTGRPMITDHPDGSVLVYYPSLTPLPLVNGQPGADPLVDLLGRTRAAILTRAVVEQTTGRLAGDLGISAAAVSEHVRILRRAGMLASQRHGKKVLHVATPLGERLLRESTPSPAQD
jgi:DNA-binding transcriptional ArsR family regulator